MKKKIALIGIGVALLAAFWISIPVVNNMTADKVKKELLDTPLPEHTEIMDSFSQAGKLAGNGNGMQYLGAILIKSELTLEEINAHYAQYKEHADSYVIVEGSSVSLDMTVVTFSVDIQQDEQYYVVYSWGTGIKPFSELDIRGH